MVRGTATEDGHEARRRRTNFIVVSRSAELQAAEDALGLALIAMVGGSRPSVSPAMVASFLFQRFSIVAKDADVRRHDPEDFVVWFQHRVDRDRVLASPPGRWGPFFLWFGDLGGGLRWPAAAPSISECWWGLGASPLHARNVATTQAILGLACTEVDVVCPSDVPADDDWEFFVTAWCLHPRFILDEQVVFILEPRILSPVEASVSELSGLHYLVRLRLVVFQD